MNASYREYFWSCFFSLAFIFHPNHSFKFEYHDNEQLGKVLGEFVNNTKNIHTELYQIGVSSRYQTPLFVVKLNSFKQSKILIPNVKFIANIHGNEAVGREILLHFMEYLRDNYDKDERVKCLLDNAKIHILPSMNPDGFAKAVQGKCAGELGRKNGNNFDLNRNFPDFFMEYKLKPEDETKAVMNWMERTPFILSACLHGGAMVANYPFDTQKTLKSYSRNTPSFTPDDDVFKHLATVYAQNHPFMKESRCEDGANQGKFENGTTNGAAWYSFPGGMQDYNYFAENCMELTLEISCCKYPRSTELSALWDQNKNALLMYSLEALKGIKGLVLDNASRRRISNSNLQIIGRNITFKTTENGEFWRILLPGNYRMLVQAEGFHDTIVNIKVDESKGACPRPNQHFVYLTNSSLPIIKTEKFKKINFTSRQRSLDSSQDKDRILNFEPTTRKYNPFKLSPSEEEEIFEMIFGTPDKPKGLSISEEDIQNLIWNSTTFDHILKSVEEEADLVLFSSLTDEILRNYMKNTLKIENFSKYENVLKDFDEKNAEAKKKALLELGRIYRNENVNNSPSVSSKNHFKNGIFLILYVHIILTQ